MPSDFFFFPMHCLCFFLLKSEFCSCLYWIYLVELDIIPFVAVLGILTPLSTVFAILLSLTSSLVSYLSSIYISNENTRISQKASPPINYAAASSVLWDFFCPPESQNNHIQVKDYFGCIFKYSH